MRIALVEPYILNESLKSYASKSEPTHLIGMHNALIKRGYDVKIIDAYSHQLLYKQLVEIINEYYPDIVGFTVYSYAPVLLYIKNVISLLDPRIKTVVGGPGSTFATDFIIGELKPNFVVRGYGEKSILYIIDNFCNKSTISPPNYPNSIIVEQPKPSLEEIGWIRPYDFDFYNFESSPRIQTGCYGNCVFCVGAYQKDFSYISVKNAFRQIKYLTKEKSVNSLSPVGPDFTALPHQANSIISILLKESLKINSFKPGVRLDSLTAAVSSAPDLWEDLSLKCTVSFESSIESFSPFRLKRLGKRISEKQIKNIHKDLEFILSKCKSTIVLGRIALDPTITIDEFIVDCLGYISLLKEFGNKVTIGGMLMNSFIPLPGTPSMNSLKSKNIWTSTKKFADSRMEKLHISLLTNPEFTGWCQYAENCACFSERNSIFIEILNLAYKYALACKSNSR